ncbi:hypothetical protein BC567DRAFT_267644 [Phyllosticta citribraziliensis]
MANPAGEYAGHVSEWLSHPLASLIPAGEKAGHVSKKAILAGELGRVPDGAARQLVALFHVIKELATGRTIRMRSNLRSIAPEISRTLGHINGELVVATANENMIEGAVCELDVVRSPTKGAQVFADDARERQEEIEQAHAPVDELDLISRFLSRMIASFLIPMAETSTTTSGLGTLELITNSENESCSSPTISQVALFIVADKASLLPTATNTRTCSMRSASPSKASPHKLASPRKPRTTRKAAKEAREGTPSALRLSKHTTRSASSSNASPHKLASPCKPRTTRKAVKEAPRSASPSKASPRKPRATRKAAKEAREGIPGALHCSVENETPAGSKPSGEPVNGEASNTAASEAVCVEVDETPTASETSGEPINSEASNTTASEVVRVEVDETPAASEFSGKPVNGEASNTAASDDPVNGEASSTAASETVRVEVDETTQKQVEMETIVTRGKLALARHSRGLDPMRILGKDSSFGRGLENLPVRWHEQSIVIDDAVILGPPYTLNNLKAGEGKEMTLAHIRKIMESHLAKKKASGQQPQRPGIATVTPIPPWKGG